MAFNRIPNLKNHNELTTLIVEWRQPKAGELMASGEDVLRLSRSGGESGIAFVVVGMIRKF